MFTVQGRERNRRIGEWANRRGRGFTLLEIMLAVGILGLMSLAIFRFVQANMTALRISSDTFATDAQYDGLRDFLTAEWQSLSPQRARLTGEPFKLKRSRARRDRVVLQRRDWTPYSLRAGRV